MRGNRLGSLSSGRSTAAPVVNRPGTPNAAGFAPLLSLPGWDFSNWNSTQRVGEQVSDWGTAGVNPAYSPDESVRYEALARLIAIFVTPELASAPRMPANFELLLRLNTAENAPLAVPLNWMLQSPWLSLLE